MKHFKVTPHTLERWDKTTLWHPFTQQYLWESEPTLIIESGRGEFLKDIRGKTYLDGVSSLWVNLVGHNNPAINNAIKKQLSKIAHSTFLGLSHRPAIELGRELIKIVPRGLTRVFYSDNGATAVEVALKMAFQYWVEKEGRVRKEFLAVRGGYHGDTLGAVSVGGIGAFHSKFKPLLFKANFSMSPHCYRCPFNRTGFKHRFRMGEPVRHVPRPGESRQETGCRWECLASAEKILHQRKGEIGAVIVEPLVQAAGGMLVMPPGYVAGLRALSKKFDVLFITDEVATGFLRTGTLFACEQEKVTPDILCLAKSITGGYSPLAATLTTEKIYRAFRAPVKKSRTFFHGHSYTAHPLGAAAGLATLKYIKQSKLLEKSTNLAHIMREELTRLVDRPHVGSIRQAGLMAGIELVKNTSSRESYPFYLRMGARVCRRLLREGIWTRPLGDVIVVLPPPIISERNVRRLIRSVGHAISQETST